MTAEERFSSLVDVLANESGVSPPGASPARGFGSDALKVNGSIFAMLADGWLVVKLPSERVSEMLVDGTGRPFSAGKGRPMREWVAVDVDHGELWEELARAALLFVGRNH
jgi:hypothetical protein